MSEIKHYILSTFNYGIDIDSKQPSYYNTLSLLDKESYNVYITPIKNPCYKFKQDIYNTIIKNALNMWSNVLFEKHIKFNIVDSPYRADIKVYWSKTGRRYAGRQFSEENLNYIQRCASIGIVDINGNAYSDEEIYHLVLHEFGHMFGLGHSKNINDVMSFNGNWATTLSQNDILVVNLIYSIGKYKSYSECVDYINQYISNWNSIGYDCAQEDDLLNILDNIGCVKLFNLLNQSADVNYKPMLYNYSY